MQREPDFLPPEAEDDEQQDYFLDMIEQLAERARTLGEVEVAIHLDATASARRHSLSQEA